MGCIYRGSPDPGIELTSPALAGRFFTTEPPRPFDCLTLSKHPSVQFLWWKTCSFWRSIQASPPKWICSWSFRPLSCSIVCALIAIAPASFLWNNTYLVVYNCIRLHISIEFLVISHTLFATISPTPTLSSPPSHLHKAKCMLKSESEVAQSCLFVTPSTEAYHAPPSMGVSRQGYWSGLPFTSPEDIPNPGTKPESPAL